GFPLRVRLSLQSVRAWKRDHAAHAGWSDIEIFLWHRVSVARSAPGVGRGVESADRVYRRSGDAVLLSLRSCSWEIRIGHYARAALGGTDHAERTAHVHAGDVPARIQVGFMSPFSIFPERA